MLAILSSPLGKAGVAALVVAALIGGALWYRSSVREEGFEAGKAEVTGQVQTNTIIIQREIKRAEDSGPRTPRDVSKRLRDGTF